MDILVTATFTNIWVSIVFVHTRALFQTLDSKLADAGNTEFRQLVTHIYSYLLSSQMKMVRINRSVDAARNKEAKWTEGIRPKTLIA